MSKALTFALTIIILLALNIVFPHIGNGAPNFLFLLVVLYAFREDSSGFLWLAFFSGLLLDMYSNVFFGTYILSFLIIALIINYTTRTFFSADLTVGYIAAVIIVSYLILVGLIYFINSIGIHLSSIVLPISGTYLQGKIWIDLILNLIFVGPVYLVMLLDEKIIAYYSKKRSELL